jgi:hypothetical protein
MKKFKSFRSEISEAKAKASDYNATSEKSKFGGHRANVVHKTKGNTLYTGKVSFKTPKAAQSAADAYLSGYAIGGEKAADKMMNAHIKNNKKNLVDTSVLDTMESVDEAATKVIASVELWNGKKMKKSFKNQSAAEAFIKKMQDEEDGRGYNMYAEGLDEAGPTYIDGVKYQKEKKKKGFNKDDWEWNSSKQLYKKVDEAVALDEAFLRLPGEMINGELPMAIRDLESILKGLKAGNDFDAKGFNKQMSRLTAVKKAAKKFNSEDEVPMRYQYTKKESVSLDAEGNQLDEAFNIEKGTNVKMKAGSDKDLYGTVIKQVKVNGKPGVTVQWKNGVKGNFRMDQFASVSMDRKADYQVNDDGVRF